MTSFSTGGAVGARTAGPLSDRTLRHRMPFGRWPLKRQIRLLGLLGLATVLASLALAVALVRQSESARVADAASHLAQSASQMVERYDYLRQSFKESGASLPLDGGDDAFLQ